MSRSCARSSSRPSSISRPRATARSRRSFSPAAGSLLGAPSFDSGYVFPVGGGPSIVSVSHYHHDYPAADIAAPEGSPVYALADALVLRAWQLPNGNCGIGLSIRTADGQSWTYCHLSYLDPGISAGVQLAGGAAVGLVGQTGHATGPHLHLQLDPTASYPQEQAWFQRFAGTAFRWQDSGPTDTGPAGARSSRSSRRKRLERRARLSASPVRGMTPFRRPADGMSMAVRLAALLPRAVVVALVWVLATAAFTFAADTTIIGPKSATSTSTPAKAPSLSCPTVTGQAYVFAKGILEDGGFAWHVTGGVRGYASNRVMAQSPAAGTRVVDTGAPMIVLRLVRGAYAEKGIPVDASSYLGTGLSLQTWQRQPSRLLP